MSDDDHLLSTEDLIQKAIRKWLKIVVRRPRPLPGGISGDSVNIVDAEIHFPALELKPTPVHCVMKFSAREGFEALKQKYEMVPQPIRKWFVNVHVLREFVDGQYFMVMPHLEKFQTISEIVSAGAEAEIQPALELASKVLDEVHFFPEGRPTDKPSLGSVITVYLADVQRSFEEILGKPLRLKEIFDIAGEKIHADDGNGSVELHPPQTCLEKLALSLKKISLKSFNWCHGDCHARNIMIRLQEPDLKFIDYDRLSNHDDYINDFGELLADLKVYDPLRQARGFQFAPPVETGHNQFSYTIPRSERIEKAITFIEEHAKKIADRENDSHYVVRLHLSMARYLLEMVSRTRDDSKAFIIYCEGLKLLNAAMSA